MATHCRFWGPAKRIGNTDLAIVIAKGIDLVMLRDTLEVLTTFGEGGRQSGESYGPHSL